MNPDSSNPFQEKRKDRKMWKIKSEEKVGGFSSASLFPTRKRESVTQGGTIYHLMWRRTQVTSIVKGWEDNETEGAFQIHSHKTRIHERGPPYPPNN